MAGQGECAELWLFREQVYESLGRRRDALFELLVAGLVISRLILALPQVA